MIIYLLFLVVPNYLGIVLVNNLDGKKNKYKINLFIKILIGSGISYFLHGISGWVGFYKYLKKKILNIKVEKGKTKMKR